MGAAWELRALALETDRPWLSPWPASCLFAVSSWEVTDLPVSLSVKWGKEYLSPSWVVVGRERCCKGQVVWYRNAFQTGHVALPRVWKGALVNPWSALQVRSLLHQYKAMIILILWFMSVHEGQKLPEKGRRQGHENYCLQYHVF